MTYIHYFCGTAHKWKYFLSAFPNSISTIAAHENTPVAEFWNSAVKEENAAQINKSKVDTSVLPDMLETEADLPLMHDPGRLSVWADIRGYICQQISTRWVADIRASANEGDISAKMIHVIA